MLKFFLNIFKLILNPPKGWEDIQEENANSRELWRSGFMTLLVLATLSCFGMFLKIEMRYDIGEVLTAGITMFTSYFATLYLAVFIFNLQMPKLSTKSVSTNRYFTFIMYCLGVMLLFNLVANLIPIEQQIWQLLPLYAAVIIYKGIDYMGVIPAKDGQFMFLAVGAIMVPPYLITFLFKVLLPE